MLNKIINSSSPISDEQIRYILDKISENPNILTEIEFTPECLMKLIEKNSNLATEIIIKISKTQCFEEYKLKYKINYFSRIKFLLKI